MKLVFLLFVSLFLVLGCFDGDNSSTNGVAKNNPASETNQINENSELKDVTSTGKVNQNRGEQNSDVGSGDNDDNDFSDEEPGVEVTSWKSVSLKDIRTGQNYKVSDYSSKPILLETFAVWCSRCKSQQDQLKKLHKQIGDEFVSITVNLDSREDEVKILNHINSNGYDWLYSINTGNFGGSLIEEFGFSVANPPSAPIVLICPNGEAMLLDFGVKSSGSLLKSIESCSS